MGLQNDRAVPRTLFESYNAIRTHKEYYIYPYSGQTYREEGDVLQKNFLRKY